MVRDISIDLWLCKFILSGSSQASHVPVVQYTYLIGSMSESSDKNEKNTMVIVISVV